MEDFIILDCSLLSRTSDTCPPPSILRELRYRLATCRQEVLYHHFCEPPLVPCFDNPDSRKDFAVWALAERFGIINPYIFTDLERLREEVLG